MTTGNPQNEKGRAESRPFRRVSRSACLQAPLRNSTPALRKFMLLSKPSSASSSFSSIGWAFLASSLSSSLVFESAAKAARITKRCASHCSLLTSNLFNVSDGSGSKFTAAMSASVTFSFRLALTRPPGSGRSPALQHRERRRREWQYKPRRSLNPPQGHLAQQRAAWRGRLRALGLPFCPRASDPKRQRFLWPDHPLGYWRGWPHPNDGLPKRANWQLHCRNTDIRTFRSPSIQRLCQLQLAIPEPGNGHWHASTPRHAPQRSPQVGASHRERWQPEPGGPDLLPLRCGGGASNKRARGEDSAPDGA